MKTIVLDASVILTALLHEDSNVAKVCEELFVKSKKDTLALYILPLTLLEIGNGLRFSIKDSSLATTIMERFLQLPYSLFDFSPQHAVEALRLAYTTDTTVYDTSYHIVALLLDGIFLTYDKEYYEKTKGLGSVEMMG